eukprot:SM000013S26560  [mRNA]  locus=s13:1161056:1167347:+ [translate_table: standard]
MASAAQVPGLEGCCPAAGYALRRLVRGLASSRQGARQGFALALTLAAEALPAARAPALVALVAAHLELPSASSKGQDAKDVLLGRVFAYGAIVRSGRLRRPHGEALLAAARDVAQGLLDAAGRKSFLREPAAVVLLELALQMGEAELEASVCKAPLFAAWLSMPPEEASPEALLLSLRLWRQLPPHVLADVHLLPASGLAADLFSAAHLAILSPALKVCWHSAASLRWSATPCVVAQGVASAAALGSRSTVLPQASSRSHPRLHLVWPALLDLLAPLLRVDNQTLPEAVAGVVAKPRRRVGKTAKTATIVATASPAKAAPSLEKLAAFWTVVVEGALVPSSHERKSLALELLQLLLPSLSAGHVGAVLSGPLVRCITDAIASTEAYLHKTAQRCLHKLEAWAVQRRGCRMAVVAVLQQHTHGRFDLLTKTATVKRLSAALDEAGALDYLRLLKDGFLQGSSSGSGPSSLALTMGPLPNGHARPATGSRRERDDGEEAREDVGEEGGGEEDGGEGAGAQRIWMVEQMCALAKQGQFSSEARAGVEAEVLRFLLVHSAFHVEPLAQQKKAGKLSAKGRPLPSEELRQAPATPLPAAVREVCKARLMTLLTHCCHCSTPRTRKQGEEAALGPAGQEDAASERSGSAGDDGVHTGSRDVLMLLTDFSKAVERAPATRPVQERTQEQQAALAGLWAALGHLKSVRQQGANNGHAAAPVRMAAMEVLLAVILLQGLMDPAGLGPEAEELPQLCSRLFQGKFPAAKVAESDSTPPDMDVLVDILLSLLARPSLLARTASEQVFRAFWADLTATGLKDMLRIIQKQPKGVQRRTGKRSGGSPNAEEEEDEDDDLLEEEGDEDEDDEGEEDDAGGEVGASVGEKAEEEEEEEEEEGEEVEEQEEVGARDGGARPRRDMGEEEEEDDDEDEAVDDEAMLRMDSSLAQMLKLRGAEAKGEAKEAQAQLQHFKFRVLNLVDLFLKRCPSSPLVVLAVAPLLQAFAGSLAPEGSPALAERILGVLRNRICKSKEYPRGPELDMATVVDLLTKLVNLASRATNTRVASVAAECSHWALKVLHTRAPSEVIIMQQIYSSALLEYFKRKKSRLQRRFFSETFRRQPWLGRSLLAQVLESAASAGSEYLLAESWQLLADLLRDRSNVDGLRHCLQPHLAAMGKLVTSLLSRDFTKPARKVQALQSAAACLQATKSVLSTSTPLHVLLEISAPGPSEPPSSQKLAVAEQKVRALLLASRQVTGKSPGTSDAVGDVEAFKVNKRAEKEHAKRERRANRERKAQARAKRELEKAQAVPNGGQRKKQKEHADAKVAGKRTEQTLEQTRTAS